MSQSILELSQSSSVQKTAQKNTLYTRNETILTIAHHETLSPMQNRIFGAKIKIPKNKSKSTLEVIQSSSVQKTARKNTQYSRNEIILKIGHHAKHIAFAKSSVWVKNKNSKKHIKNHSRSDLEQFCAKNRSEKHSIFEK